VPLIITSLGAFSGCGAIHSYGGLSSFIDIIKKRIAGQAAEAVLVLDGLILVAAEAGDMQHHSTL